KAIKSCYLDARSRIPDAARLRQAGLDCVRVKLSGAAKVLDLARSGHKVSWTRQDAESAEAFRRSRPDGEHFLVSPGIFASGLNHRCRRTSFLMHSTDSDIL